MKFIVDEMPKSKSECPFSEWKPYPPVMEKTGHHVCKINHNDCNLCETECQSLKWERSVKQMDREKILKGLECCQYSSKSHCDGCPYDYNARGYCNECTADLASDVLSLLKEQGAIIEQYSRADGFLAAHGWKWEDGEPK